MKVTCTQKVLAFPQVFSFTTTTFSENHNLCSRTLSHQHQERSSSDTHHRNVIHEQQLGERAGEHHDRARRQRRRVRERCARPNVATETDLLQDLQDYPIGMLFTRPPPGAGPNAALAANIQERGLFSFGTGLAEEEQRTERHRRRREQISIARYHQQQSRRRCLSDRRRIREEEDAEDKEELYGIEEELSYEGQSEMGR